MYLFILFFNDVIRWQQIHLSLSTLWWREQSCVRFGDTLSDLFSPLSSSRSSGENVILHLNEEKRQDETWETSGNLFCMGARMALRSVLMSSFVSYVAERHVEVRLQKAGARRRKRTAQKTNQTVKNNQMSRLRCADMCRPLSRPTARCWWGKTSWSSSGSFWWAACLSAGSSSQDCSSPQCSLFWQWASTERDPCSLTNVFISHYCSSWMLRTRRWTFDWWSDCSTHNDVRSACCNLSRINFFCTRGTFIILI